MTAVDNEFTHSDGVVLEKYIDEKLDAHCDKCLVCRRSIDDKFTAANNATDLAREVTNAKFASVNEWRKTYGDLVTQFQGMFLPREEYTLAHQNLIDKIDAAMKGKVTWGVAFAVTFLTSVTLMSLAILVTHFWK